VAGLRGFRAAIAALPEDTEASIAASLEALAVPEARVDDYLHRALLQLGGWAGLLRARDFLGDALAPVRELLAIRLAWDAALHALHPAHRPAWQAGWAMPPPAAPDLAPALARLDDAEAAYRDGLAARLAGPAAAGQAPEVQAVFCIDVRSERYRRALEACSPRIATLGFAGFFGFAIEHVRFGDARGAAQYPVLLAPAAVICEAVPDATPAEAAALRRELGLRRRLSDLWNGFRAAAVSCFAYVEAAGLTAAAGLLRGALRRPVEDAPLPGLAPELAAGTWQGRATGLAATARLDAAEGVLRAMSLTRGFGGLVLLVGHAARTVNNPHAASLDCGACGGHSGESNARVAAAVLNDPLVRQGLRARGILIPADTWFLAALHDTTTDRVRLFEAGRVPASQAPLLRELHGWLDRAGAACRMERAPTLGLAPGADAALATQARAADWSELRPEWALANNAAFIAAPRARTRGRDLEGRAFLHSYDWRDDAGSRVLELILTAPMVVASWINLQYYGSTVDNAAWGSGNKALHNVVGLAGVLEGQAGDLRGGLPWQSVHDGERFMHEPLRLQVLVEAPEDAMDAVLARHPQVAQLVEHGWLHLFSLGEDGALRRRHGAATGAMRAAPGNGRGRRTPRKEAGRPRPCWRTPPRDLPGLLDRSGSAFGA
jgi:uncharacterized protein YbcC (UPF0753/DUF2309 family)